MDDKPRHITVEWLNQHGADPNDVERFKELFGTSAELTAENLSLLDPDEACWIIRMAKLSITCEHPDGTKIHYQNGKIHRDNDPAIVYADGTKFYYQNGKCDRDNGPAVEYPDGTKKYYKNGKLYWAEWADGTKEYFQTEFERK